MDKIGHLRDTLVLPLKTMSVRLPKTMAKKRVATEVYCVTIGRMIMSQSLGLAVVIAVRMASIARLRRGGVDPELCIAAGRSPLNTWTITDADSVKENNVISSICRIALTLVLLILWY